MHKSDLIVTVASITGFVVLAILWAAGVIV